MGLRRNPLENVEVSASRRRKMLETEGLLCFLLLQYA